MMQRIFVTGIISSLWLTPVIAAEKEDKHRYEDEDIVVRIVPRTKENILAFYHGRGFPTFAYPEIKKVCYVTYLIRNKSNTIQWLELDNWLFLSNDKGLRRLDRNYWKDVWTKRGLKMNYQSTFGWSLLPEVRDLHPDEPVGGSVTLSQTDLNFVSELRFRLGRDKDEGEKIVRFEQVSCKE